MLKRSVVISVRVKNDELARIELNAQKVGINRSKYIRNMSLNGEIIFKYGEETLKQLNLLRSEIISTGRYFSDYLFDIEKGDFNNIVKLTNHIRKLNQNCIEMLDKLQQVIE